MLHKENNTAVSRETAISGKNYLHMLFELSVLLIYTDGIKFQERKQEPILRFITDLCLFCTCQQDWIDIKKARLANYRKFRIRRPYAFVN